MASMVALAACAHAQVSWTGVLRDDAGKPVADATIKLNSTSGHHEYTEKTAAGGQFVFTDIAAGTYKVEATAEDKTWSLADFLIVGTGAVLPTELQFSTEHHELRMASTATGSSAQASGGEHLSSGEVSSLPLNSRDFSKLLLLAAGTMTDANGAANFTQQFAVNGQRGSATVFAIDDGDTTDS